MLFFLIFVCIFQKYLLPLHRLPDGSAAAGYGVILGRVAPAQPLILTSHRHTSYIYVHLLHPPHKPQYNGRSA